MRGRELADSRPWVASFYLFRSVDDVESVRSTLESACRDAGVRGTILIAPEGVNGSIVGTRQALGSVVAGHLADFDVRWSRAKPDNAVFHRLRVRARPEIVSFGFPLGADQRLGEHVDGDQWNELLDDPDVVVIDTRNHYESAIGTFRGAIPAETESFREFPEFVDRALDPTKHPKVAMFCTGGIRCEKASALLLERGFESVYQLDGGILRYLAETDDEENAFEGDCFVFDQRVSLTAALEQGDFEQCHACRRAISTADMASDAYEPGVSCPQCVDELDARRRAGFEERARQQKLATERGSTHVRTPHASGRES